MWTRYESGITTSRHTCAPSCLPVMGLTDGCDRFGHAGTVVVLNFEQTYRVVFLPSIFSRADLDSRSLRSYILQ